MQICNIAAYKFIDLSQLDLPTFKEELLAICRAQNLKGTILLSPEGINVFMAGLKANVAQLQSFLAAHPSFSDLQYKESWSEAQPFKRLYIKLKKEIITFGKSEINPIKEQAAYVSPAQLKEWYEEQKDMVILDTRNTYETEHGIFANAIDLKIDSFCNFPGAVAKLPEQLKEKTVVTYCTGGIRCEKAALYLAKQGFKKVYQLEGGILNYFEQCGDAHYEGDCFVFDERVAVDPQLKPASKMEEL